MDKDEQRWPKSLSVSIKKIPEGHNIGRIIILSWSTGRIFNHLNPSDVPFLECASLSEIAGDCIYLKFQPWNRIAFERCSRYETLRSIGAAFSEITGKRMTVHVSIDNNGGHP